MPSAVPSVAPTNSVGVKTPPEPPAPSVSAVITIFTSVTPSRKYQLSFASWSIGMRR